MAVTTSQAFVDDLEKSNILTSDQLAKAHQQAGDESDPKKIARRLIQSGILTRWQATELINGRCDLTRGKYKLLERLGQKKTSEVYLAEHSQMARRVAIRMLKKSDKGFNDFVTEARSIASFDHRNIVHVYDIDSDGENYYLVMENIQGKDLALRVETDGKMDFAQVAECMRQAAAGLDHAHQRGVVHRNICPSNMILDDKGSLKIINMGVARLSDEHDINEQADLFSLGCTCYFLLAGHPPFGEEKYSEHKLGENPPTPRGIQHDRPDAPGDLVAICRKMMAKDRNERFQSAKQVEAVFEKWLAKNHGSNSARANGTKQTAPAPKKPAAKPAARSKTTAKAPPARASKTGNGAATPKSKKTPTSASKPASTPVASGEPAAGDFAFADSKKRTKTTKAATAAPTLAASSSEAASPAANNVAPKKKLPMGLILGGVAAGVLVLGGIGALAFMLFGGGDDEKDVADASANPAVTTTANPGDEPSNPEPSNPEPSNPDPANPPTDPANPKTDPNDNNEVVKVDPNDKPVDPPKEPVDPPKVPVDPPKEPDPGNTTPPPTDPGPTKPTVEEPKAEPVTNPFLKLPATLALPANAPAEGQSAQPAVLGNLGKIDPRTTIFVRLDGAGGAIKGDKYMFEIESARGGLAKRDWEIFVSPSANEAGDEPGPQIASLQIKDDKLLFHWTEAGATDPNAAYLQNCILQMSFGDFVSNTALRKPLMAEPIELDFSLGNRLSLDSLDNLPDVAKLRLELSLVGLPKHNFGQASTFNPAPKGGTYASIGDGESLFVNIKTTFARKGALAFVVSPMAKLGEGAPISLRGKTKEFDKPNAPNPYEFQLQQLRQGKANLEAQKGKAQNNQKKAFDAPINRAKGMITNMQSMSESYKNLLAAYKAAKAGEGKLHYRLYFLASGQEIDLAMSRPRQVKKPAKKQPAKK